MRRVTGTVYFVQNVETKYIKIGWTEKWIELRVRNLAAGFPGPLRATFKVLGGLGGSLEVERAIHQAFRQSRRPMAFAMFGTECFAPTRHLLGFLKGLSPHYETGLLIEPKYSDTRGRWHDVRRRGSRPAEVA